MKKQENTRSLLSHLNAKKGIFIRFIFILIISNFVISDSLGQNDILSEEIILHSSSHLRTKRDILNYISKAYNLVFSYNASELNVDEAPKRLPFSGSLSFVLNEVFGEKNINLTYLPPNKIVLQRQLQEASSFNLSGIIINSETNEALYGAQLIEQNSGISVISNENGYFIMQLPPGHFSIRAFYLAYKAGEYQGTINKNTYIRIPMESDNFLDTIIIHKSTSKFQLADGGDLLKIFQTREFKSIIGETNVVNNARILPGIHSGGEGMSGLYIRGGTPDQNLILLDGVPVYEASHIAGISSIFIDESIKSISFIKNSFPARYGGRLSGVMDVQLNEGDKRQNHTSITAGLAGVDAHVNGPIIKDKLTYSLSGRTSWLNFYVNNLLKKFTKYDDIILSYHDLLGKITWHHSGTSNLSLTLYNGSDRFGLEKSTVIDSPEMNYHLSVYDNNRIGWNNTLASLKWSSIVGDKFKVSAQAGYLKYNNNTRSSYVFESSFQDTSNTDILDVLTHSDIKDYNFKVNVDYYAGNEHVIRGGFDYMIQQFNPAVKQSTIIISGSSDGITDKDSVLHGRQYHAYIEDNYNWSDKIYLYGGIHLSGFRQASRNFTTLEPRINAIWAASRKQSLSISFGYMTQFLHLLSNSGLGLPSGLWVPSTESIKPESLKQLSVGYNYNFNKGLYVSLSAYTRQYHNLLEYTTPVEMFYFLINNQNIVTVYNTSKDWERNVISGNGHSKGLELLIHKTLGSYKGWLSVSRSRTTRSFEDINDGEAFPASNDRPWDINLGLNHRFSQKISAGVNFIYNTGNPFSLSTEEYDSYLGIKLLKSEGRNNYRLPDFHQLSFNASFHTQNDNFETETSLNVYNVYNRLNAYFIYIYKNPITPEEAILKKVSILPITPSVSFKVKF